MYKLVVKEEEMGDSEDSSDGEIVKRQLVTLSCVGVGYSNFSKGIM